MTAFIIKEKVADLYFVFQPIVQKTPGDSQIIHSYEVLLRSRKDGRFPIDLFLNLISNEESNEILLDEYRIMVYDFMNGRLNVDLSLNLHQEQLFRKSTWEFLKEIQVFSNRITIEFTEFLPNSYVGNTISTRQWMCDINKLGYRIALDDVDSGLNSLQFVMEHIDLIQVIKFSLLPFRMMDRPTILHFIEGWIKISEHYKVGLVVEAVEDEELANQLSCLGANYQQGYFWGRGKVLI
ncbi:EAL domain-containing protein [Jeotgalibaca porci]|uniref:EAL domain-containing protein n=1 Tax=Jeotgalibaca porci TaxID=1868793 RepID=UPI003F91A1B3